MMHYDKKGRNQASIEIRKLEEMERYVNPELINRDKKAVKKEMRDRMGEVFGFLMS